MQWTKKNKEEVTHHKSYFLSDPKSIVSEQFKMLRTNINFLSINQKIKSIVVTASDGSVGKTTISSNLAAAFASQNKRVLLVETDLRKSSIHKVFNLQNKIGLTTLIMSQDYKVMEAINKSNIENLFILTSGIQPPNPTELLSSKRMTDIMEGLENEFDLVIYDTPPITAVADAQIMAGKTDGTIFIVRKDRDSKDKIRKSKALLDAANTNVLGAVFNMEPVKEKSLYYG